MHKTSAGGGGSKYYQSGLALYKSCQTILRFFVNNKMLPTHKALPRNLSANSTARNVACMYIGTYAYAYSWNQEKIYRFYHKKWSILSLNWDKYFALYWCFCVRISSILLLIKWSEMDPNAGCEATDLDWDFWPSQLQFYPGVALITLLTYPVNIKGHNDGFPRNTAMKNTF